MRIHFAVCKTFSSRLMQAGAVVRAFVLAFPTNVPAVTSRLVIALFDNVIYFVECRVENAARTKRRTSFSEYLAAVYANRNTLSRLVGRAGVASISSHLSP